MFWTSVKLGRKKTLPMATKLMGLYTLSTLGLLLLIGIALYPTFHKLISHLSGQTATDITLECYKTLILSLLFACAAAMIMGNWIAKQGLNKIQDLQKNMEAISAQALHERIKLDDWPQELKSLGHCFNEMLYRLEGSFIQLTQFSSDIAHELRQPIHCLKQITEVELTKPTLSPGYESTLLIYMSELDQLSKLIEQLLFIARSEQRQVKLKKQTASLQKMVQKVYEFYQLLADEKQITLECEGDVSFAFDTTLMQQVISNLISNSIHYTESGGKIFICIRLVDNRQVEIAVHDNGMGIDEKHLSKLCDRFYRVDISRQHKGGLGLGLAIVKSIVELHQGTLKITSHLGKGTSVSLCFPY